MQNVLETHAEEWLAIKQLYITCANIFVLTVLSWCIYVKSRMMIV